LIARGDKASITVKVFRLFNSSGFLGVINPRLFLTPASIVVCLLIPTVAEEPVEIPNTPSIDLS